MEDSKLSKNSKSKAFFHQKRVDFTPVYGIMFLIILSGLLRFIKKEKKNEVSL